jgi:hypothetical protein
MYIKVHKAKPTGIPAAQVTAVPGVTGAGASQVTINVSAFNSHSIPTVVAGLRLSTWEARDLAARIEIAADEADALTELIPPCAAFMGCLCVGHACGNDANAACDTNEERYQNRDAEDDT